MTATASRKSSSENISTKTPECQKTKSRKPLATVRKTLAEAYNSGTSLKAWQQRRMRKYTKQSVALSSRQAQAAPPVYPIGTTRQDINQSSDSMIEAVSSRICTFPDTTEVPPPALHIQQKEKTNKKYHTPEQSREVKGGSNCKGTTTGIPQISVDAQSIAAKKTNEEADAATNITTLSDMTECGLIVVIGKRTQPERKEGSPRLLQMRHPTEKGADLPFYCATPMPPLRQQKSTMHQKVALEKQPNNSKKKTKDEESFQSSFLVAQIRKIGTQKKRKSPPEKQWKRCWCGWLYRISNLYACNETNKKQASRGPTIRSVATPTTSKLPGTTTSPQRERTQGVHPDGLQPNHLRLIADKEMDNDGIRSEGCTTGDPNQPNILMPHEANKEPCRRSAMTQHTERLATGDSKGQLPGAMTRPQLTSTIQKEEIARATKVAHKTSTSLSALGLTNTTTTTTSTGNQVFLLVPKAMTTTTGTEDKEMPTKVLEPREYHVRYQMRKNNNNNLVRHAQRERSVKTKTTLEKRKARSPAHTTTKKMLFTSPTTTTPEGTRKRHSGSTTTPRATLLTLEMTTTPTKTVTANVTPRKMARVTMTKTARMMMPMQIIKKKKKRARLVISSSMTSKTCLQKAQNTHQSTDLQEARSITKSLTSIRLAVFCLMMDEMIFQSSKRMRTRQLSRVMMTLTMHTSTYMSYGILPYGISRYKFVDLPSFVSHLSAYLIVHTARPPGWRRRSLVITAFES